MTLTDARDKARPQAVLCAGLYSSGSTWIFNVVIALAKAAGRKVVGVFADEVDQLVHVRHADDLLTVIKTHSPGPGLRVLCGLADIPIVLSVRDPRDAVLSLMSRFDMDFDEASQRVRNSAAKLVQLTDERDRILKFYYESKFTSEINSIEAIANSLGLKVDSNSVKSIYSSLTPAAVSLKISELTNAGSFKSGAAAETWDHETQWHPSHVGDGKSGKWRQGLLAAQAASVAFQTHEFRETYKYLEVSPSVPGESINFSPIGTGAQYLRHGFSTQEDWGVWTVAECAEISIPLTRPLGGPTSIYMNVLLGPSLLRSTAAYVVIRACGAELRIEASDLHAQRVLVAIALPFGDYDTVEIEITGSGLASSVELGLNDEDTRLLGIGIADIKIIDY